MSRLKTNLRKFIQWTSDENFIHFLEIVEVILSKVLSLAMLALIISETIHLVIFLVQELIVEPELLFKNRIFDIFGLFLNILIALELLENISAYLKKHVLQIELVLITSLIAVARKIILFNLDDKTGIDLIGLALALLCLAISYWIIRQTNKENREE